MCDFKYVRIKKHIKFIKVTNISLVSLAFRSFVKASEKKRNICSFDKFCVFFLFVYICIYIYIYII